MSKPTTLNVSDLVGEVRSLESLHGLAGDEVRERLRQAFGLIGEVADPGLKDDLNARLARVFVARLEHALSAHGWVERDEHVYTYTPGGEDSKFRRFTLVGIVSAGTRTLGVVCPPQAGRGQPDFVDRLGTAVGLEQIEGMLTCIDAEFTPREVVVELDDATILAELERRRTYIDTLDPQLFNVAEAMSDACGQADYVAWFQHTGLTDVRRHQPGGEVSVFAEWVEGAQVYDPALSTGGYFNDDCSSIWAARGARFGSREEAFDWARERAGRAPAYYRLSPEWRHVCTGKQWNKYSGY